MVNVLHVVGARPNFMKMAPVMRAIEALGCFSQKLIHTGQHYDTNMSDIFFQQLGMPQPDANLEVGSGTQTVQTAQIMIRFEEVLLRQRPDVVVVYGDVNSTLAASVVCAKHRVPVAHVEAGLRSFDRTMPEEINRLLTDQIATWLFTPSQDGNRNLEREGISAAKVRFVGNVMVDTLVKLLPHARLPLMNGLENRFMLVTLHRPSNVDNADAIHDIVQSLEELSVDVQVVFPIHPRTRRRLVEFGLTLEDRPRFRLLDPLGYLEFLALQQKASVVVTDSGGVQEETTFLGVPCLTLRENTERPITVEVGSNILVGRDVSRLKAETKKILDGFGKKGQHPPLWDGKASERIAEILAKVA